MTYRVGRRDVGVTKRRRSYRKYLQSGHWRALRKQALQVAEFRCEKCKYRKKLQVHHQRYRNLHDVELGDLVVLCERCHMDLHHPQRVARRAKEAKKKRRWNNRRTRQSDFYAQSKSREKWTFCIDVHFAGLALDENVNEMFRQIRVGNVLR